MKTWINNWTHFKTTLNSTIKNTHKLIYVFDYMITPLREGILAKHSEKQEIVTKKIIRQNCQQSSMLNAKIKTRIVNP